MISGVLSIDEARAAILAAVTPLPTEEVALVDAHGRVLAEDIVAGHDVPPFDNSAMDGFAVRGTGPDFTVVGESRAGAPFDGEIQDGQSVTISTGAAIPAGAEAVVPIERAVKTTSEVGSTAQGWRAEGEIAPGDNIRRAGEDQKTGTRVLQKGTKLRPAELGIAAGAGRATVRVAKRPKVAIVATGDELVTPGQPLQPGQIYETNALSLAALCAETGATVALSRRAPDERDATVEALREALQAADLVLISGGVSVGPHDHVKPALEELGVTEHFWRVALRPGKPTWFGTHEKTLVIGLPGNPVSALVTFTLFARPALAALQGDAAEPRRLRLTLAAAVPRHPQRDEAVRVRIGDDGGIVPTGPQGSHMLTSLAGADGLALVPRGEGEVASGEIVEVVMLR